MERYNITVDMARTNCKECQDNIKNIVLNYLSYLIVLYSKKGYYFFNVYTESLDFCIEENIVSYVKGKIDKENITFENLGAFIRSALTTYDTTFTPNQCKDMLLSCNNNGIEDIISYCTQKLRDRGFKVLSNPKTERFDDNFSNTQLFILPEQEKSIKKKLKKKRKKLYCLI